MGNPTEEGFLEGSPIKDSSIKGSLMEGGPIEGNTIKSLIEYSSIKGIQFSEKDY
jgi:hypothetical protein